MIRASARLMEEGCLWNTIVVVARALSLLELIVETTLHLAGSFPLIRRGIGTHWQQQVVEKVHRTISPANFLHRCSGSVSGATGSAAGMAACAVEQLGQRSASRRHVDTSGRSGSVSACSRLVQYCTHRRRKTVSVAQQEGRGLMEGYGLRVLVVEDDESTRYLISAVLSKAV